MHVSNKMNLGDFEKVQRDIENSRFIVNRRDEIEFLIEKINKLETCESKKVYYIDTDIFRMLHPMISSSNGLSGCNRFVNFVNEPNHFAVENLVYVERTECDAKLSIFGHKAEKKSDGAVAENDISSFNNFVNALSTFNRHVESYTLRMKEYNRECFVDDINVIKAVDIRFDIIIYNISYFLYVFIKDYVSYFKRRKNIYVNVEINLHFKDVYYDPTPFYRQKYRENTESKPDNPIFKYVRDFIPDMTIKHLNTINIYSEIQDKKLFCEKILKYLKK